MDIYLRFYEIEHAGDLERCLDDLRASGADILGTRPDFDQEEASVKIHATDFPSFKTAFQQTESADFCDSLDWLEVPDA